MGAGAAPPQDAGTVALRPYRKVASRALIVLWILGIGVNLSSWISAWMYTQPLRDRGQEFGPAAFLESGLWVYWIVLVLWMLVLIACYRLRNIRVSLLRDGFEIIDLRARVRTIPYGEVTAISHGGGPVDGDARIPAAGSLCISYRDSADKPGAVWLPWLRTADRGDIGVLVQSIRAGRPLSR